MSNSAEVDRTVVRDLSALTSLDSVNSLVHLHRTIAHWIARDVTMQLQVLAIRWTSAAAEVCTSIDSTIGLHTLAVSTPSLRSTTSENCASPP